MPRLMATDEDMVIDLAGAGNFSFSAVRIENLGATEYTLVTLVIDITGSVVHFADELLEMVKNIVDACKKHPRAENLLLRIVTFNTVIDELHGFKELHNIDISSYKAFHPDGMTRLFDATYESVSATLEYSKRLMDQDFDVNGAVYIVTDGLDNRSTMGPGQIKEKINTALQNEDIIESMITVLVGLNDPNSEPTWKQQVADELKEFKDEAGITQFVDVGDATPGKLAKLAGFVSQSVSSQSQALGTGAPSQPITF